MSRRGQSVMPTLASQDRNRSVLHSPSGSRSGRPALAGVELLDQGGDDLVFVFLHKLPQPGVDRHPARLDAGDRLAGIVAPANDGFGIDGGVAAVTGELPA